MPEVVVQPLGKADLPEVGRLIREAYDPAYRPYLAYCQDGVESYLRDSLNYPGLTGDAARFVAKIDGRVRGFADWRMPNNDRQFLSHLCVDSQFRRHGVGRALIRHQLSVAVSRVSNSWFELDVFLSNTAAVRLYQTLGLDFVNAPVRWIVRDISGRSSVKGVTNLDSNAISAVAMYERYGFSYLDGSVEGRKFRVGLIGPTIVRALTWEDFIDDTLLSCLQSSFPRLRASLMVGDVRGGRTDTTDVLESRRMRASASLTLEALHG